MPSKVLTQIYRLSAGLSGLLFYSTYGNGSFCCMLAGSAYRWSFMSGPHSGVSAERLAAAPLQRLRHFRAATRFPFGQLRYD
jgi:hypothetical protein